MRGYDGGMRAFEISVNGTVVRTISVGQYGLLSAEVLSVNSPQNRDGVEQLAIFPSGVVKQTRESYRWPRNDLKVGDVVTIRIVEADYPGDPPSVRMPHEERSPDSKTTNT